MKSFDGPAEEGLTITPEKIQQPVKPMDAKAGGQTADRRIGNMREFKLAVDAAVIDDLDDEIAQLFGVADE